MYPAREAGNFCHRAKPAPVPGFGEAEAGEVCLAAALCRSVEQQERHAQVPQQSLVWPWPLQHKRRMTALSLSLFQMSCTIFCAPNSPVLRKGILGNLLKVTKCKPDTLDHTLYLDLFPTLYTLWGFPGGPVVKNPQCRRCRRQGFNPWVQEDPLEQEMATCSSMLPWKIPYREELSRLQYMGSQRARHNWECMHALIHSLFLFNCRKFEMRCTIFVHGIVEYYYRTFFFFTCSTHLALSKFITAAVLDFF